MGRGRNRLLETLEDAEWIQRPVVQSDDYGNVRVKKGGRVRVRVRDECNNDTVFDLFAPDGYTCDGASIPWLSLVSLPKFRCDPAGTIHDWLYGGGEGCPKISRYDADRIFYCLLRKERFRTEFSGDWRRVKWLRGHLRRLAFRWIGIPKAVIGLYFFGSSRFDYTDRHDEGWTHRALEDFCGDASQGL